MMPYALILAHLPRKSLIQRWLARWLKGGNGRRQFEGRKTLYKSRCDKPELEETAIEFIANTKDI